MSARHEPGKLEQGNASPVEARVPQQARSSENSTRAERLAYSVDEGAQLTGLSRDLLYDEMRRGNLEYLKIGRRRVITRRHLERFLDLAPRTPPDSGVEAKVRRSEIGGTSD